MSPAIQRDLLGDLASAVAAYLSAMAVIAETLEQTYPEVGACYRERILNMRKRLAYDASREAIRESTRVLEGELKDYASVTSQTLKKRSVELDIGILALGDIIENLGQQQEAYGNRLRQFAAQMEKAHYPENPQTFSEVMALQAANLRGLVESMNHETSAAVGGMRKQTSELGSRLAGTACVDPVTGLMNRRELDRQIEAHKLHGSEFSMLTFELSGPLSDQVLRKAGAKIAAQFRHRDRTGRWSEKEFAVLFLGERELAEARATQVLAAVTGRYLLDNGESVFIEAQVRLLERETVRPDSTGEAGPVPAAQNFLATPLARDFVLT